MVCRQTEYARRKRAALLVQLGNKCTDCGTVEGLEFEHPQGRDWVVNMFSSSARMARYQREADAGLLSLLCGACNKAKRKRNDNEKFVPTNSNPPITDNIPF